MINRAQSPTPPFFKKLRNIGIALATIAGVIATAPIALPASIITFAGYAAVAGSCMSAISQLTVSDTPSASDVWKDSIHKEPDPIK